jgi:hypothetical protein
VNGHHSKAGGMAFPDFLATVDQAGRWYLKHRELNGEQNEDQHDPCKPNNGQSETLVFTKKGRSRG